MMWRTHTLRAALALLPTHVIDTVSSTGAFSDSVLELLGDAPRRTHLGEAGRALYLDRFTWPRAWEHLAVTGI